ncbi:MAG: LPS assembly lipoprotein LptE [Ferruginibacter sp.]
MKSLHALVWAFFTVSLFSFATCKYSFKDTSPIPVEVKTFRVNYFENRAQYINSQLAPQLTEKLRQKIINTTRLRQTNSDEAHYDINGWVSEYYATSAGITNNATSTNRLTVGFHLVFKNTLDDSKSFETDLSTNADFNANKSLTEAENTLTADLVKNITDQIFNKIFSNW